MKNKKLVFDLSLEKITIYDPFNCSYSPVSNSKDSKNVFSKVKEAFERIDFEDIIIFFLVSSMILLILCKNRTKLIQFFRRFRKGESTQREPRELVEER